MKAIVELVHTDRGMYAARLEDTDQYAVFELFDRHAPQCGDWLTHASFPSAGNQVYCNLSQGQSIEVVAKGVCGRSAAQRACLL